MFWVALLILAVALVAVWFWVLWKREYTYRRTYKGATFTLESSVPFEEEELDNYFRMFFHWYDMDLIDNGYRVNADDVIDAEVAFMNTLPVEDDNNDEEEWYGPVGTAAETIVDEAEQQEETEEERPVRASKSESAEYSRQFDNGPFIIAEERSEAPTEGFVVEVSSDQGYAASRDDDRRRLEYTEPTPYVSDYSSSHSHSSYESHSSHDDSSYSSSSSDDSSSYDPGSNCDSGSSDSGNDSSNW